ncbi:MAG: acetate kinase [Candidatus Omnitrophica bacterium]|nr:acetate kinase [Candidatus Omnitrophota bacterium]
MNILVINCGSSSIKFKLFEMPDNVLVASGIVEKIGNKDAIVKYSKNGINHNEVREIYNHSQGLEIISTLLVDRVKGAVKSLNEIKGVGHRVVHGGEEFTGSMIIDEKVKEKIKEFIPLAPLHNPANLEGILAAEKYFPESVQVACFDTAFHTTIPVVAYLYAIPYSMYEKYKIRRYGFHGTSHRYVARRFAQIMGRHKYDVNLITCHLGNGCSITAVKNGKSIETSMGFTPLEGLVMGTRSGDIDPGVIFYLVENLGMKPSEVNKILNKESGLIGISGVSNDFRNIVESASKGNKMAQLAIEIFCYRVKKYIGSYLAVLGRVDGIIFTAGIGENQPIVREKSLEGLEEFGIIVDKGKNQNCLATEQEISSSESKIKIFVIPTNEELAIASDTYEFTKAKGKY